TCRPASTSRSRYSSRRARKPTHTRLARRCLAGYTLCLFSGWSDCPGRPGSGRRASESRGEREYRSPRDARITSGQSQPVLEQAMSLGLVGRKVGMMRIFTDDGESIPVTVLDVSNNRVTQIKTVDTDGYVSVQVAYGVRRANRVTKPQAGHFAKAGV